MCQFNEGLGFMDKDEVENAGKGDAQMENANEEEHCEVEVENSECLRKCVKNLPWSWGTEAFKAYLNERNIAFSQVKKRKNSNFGFISFISVEDAETATEQLENEGPQGKKHKVSDAFPRSWKSEDKKDAKTEKNVEEPKDVCEVVTPLGAKPYEEQLIIKKDSMAAVLKKFARQTRKCCEEECPLPDWLLNTKERGGIACEFEGVVPSPVVEGYRNKCEFSIGCTSDGNRVVGFQMGMFKNGITAVAGAGNCRNVSKVAKLYASLLEEYVRTSEFSVWDKENNSGFWRLLTVREGRNVKTSEDEVMVIIQVSPIGMSDETKMEEYKRILQTLSAQVSKASVPLTCFMIQEHNGVSNAAPADAPLIPLAIPGKGKDHEEEKPQQFIHDSLGDLQFRISPTSFFQVNSLAAEKLYALAGEWAGLGPNTLLFDICCGTGTIGITLARKVGLVVGIELNAEAVEDAKTNAKLNNISNCEFVCAKAEDVIKKVLNEYEVCDDDIKDEEGNNRKKFSNIVAIVDPPRSGLHPSVVKGLRVDERVKRVVYISCNPDTMVANAIELCAPVEGEKKKKGVMMRRNVKGMSSVGYARQRVKSMPQSQPFKPIKAVAVDLFPHTHHCEMVMLLESKHLLLPEELDTNYGP